MHRSLSIKLLEFKASREMPKKCLKKSPLEEGEKVTFVLPSKDDTLKEVS